MTNANALRRRVLGILALADPHEAPPPPPSGFDQADWFAYPTFVKTVPGAWAREVVGGNPGLAGAYAEAARELERAGVSAITADCGYTIAYQAAVREAVSIPVACSSLMELPLLSTMLPKRGRIGLLCFDEKRLSRDHLRWAGLNDFEIPIAIGGIHGTRSWENWVAVNTKTDWTVLESDVMGAARKLFRENPDISCWLLECTGFPRLRPLIQAETGLPVFDWVTLCNHLVESAAPRYIAQALCSGGSPEP